MVSLELFAAWHAVQVPQMLEGVAMGSEALLDRREFVSAAALASAGLASAAGFGFATACAATQASETSAAGGPNAKQTFDDNIYTRMLGVRPHLPAHDHVSKLGGGQMASDVLTAMIAANEYYVDLEELNDAAGKRAAELLGAEAAMITCGGFSALVLGAAACLSGTDKAKIEALPQPTWPRVECLIQTCQRFGYDRAYRDAGATIVEAKTHSDFVGRLGERTAMISGLAIAERQGVFATPFDVHRAPPPDPDCIKAEDLIAIGHKADVPVLMDMASDLPPWDNARRFLDAGADLVVLSGGKCIGGPQATGILFGKRPLIDAARLNAYPNENLGRGMKVGREEIIGLLVALERFVKMDHAAQAERWNAMAHRIVAELQGVPGLKATYTTDTVGLGDAALQWDERDIPLTGKDLTEQLAAGSPRVRLDGRAGQDNGTTVWHALARTRLLRDGEELLVARRVREVFLAAGRSGGTNPRA
jgi:seryl-tRNA(Sec) selenium transferase